MQQREEEEKEKEKGKGGEHEKEKTDLGANGNRRRIGAVQETALLLFNRRLCSPPKPTYSAQS